MRVRLSEAALADLRAIYRFGVQSFGVRKADAYSSDLRNSIKSLGVFPQAAPVRGDHRRPVRVRPSGSHVIIYLLDDRGVHILRVRYAGEDWMAAPSGEHR